MVIGVAGEQRYLKLRRYGLKRLRSFNRRREEADRFRSEKSGFSLDREVTRHGGLLTELVDEMTPTAAAKANFDFTVDALDSRGIRWWLVEDYSGHGYRIGVHFDDKRRVADALVRRRLAMPIYARSDRSGPVALSSILELATDPELGVITVAAPKKVRDNNWSFGFRFGCSVEMWTTTATESRVVVEAPAENRAAKLMSEEEFELQKSKTESGRECLTPAVLTETMLEDITFPIDAVYTWVDGADPAWVTSKRRLEAQLAGHEYHPEANHEARFESKDELKYSLRSLEYFAPWFNKVYIVTAGQLPSWLNVDHPKIVMIDHSDIYDVPDHLPTFNSNSIISRLHHIPGLSEHFIYLNDDVMFGKPVRPQDFFLPSGAVKVFPSRNHRPFGAPTAEDGPHFNLTRNIRQLLREEFGVTVTRAVKHTPYPMLKSLHFEMEEKFRGDYERTWASRFRHHDDIVADQLFHYYSQIVGKSVATSITYRYINIRDDNYRWVLRETLRQRNRSTLCLNDAPAEDVEPLSDEEVMEFLNAYFPVKSSFEA
ncbi:Stealth CR1 domain-containing protein [Brevibacterium sp. FAM 24638]|uniref:stealth family protein n=1 Tax=Brevibacterium sp. FAM 24638 TaxID=3415681 RepID=UPI003C7D8F51